ncbi:small-conductance mechanosensitive channel [Hamadaea flava]|uniref:DUF2178 domain-containing protein n=1 Tax=Hamadaea flava TaxID=1742688 RepID=A0ABV8LXH8_9ACTN|nr:hypothetical protein [Hamadaea flava]MCP2329144.1 small-conductance mechanosensitive channel [Hamadaea flava]
MSRSSKRTATYWTIPSICVAAGLAYLVSAWVGGRPGLGVVLLSAMLVFAGIVLLAARRSETVRHLLDRRDERITAIDLKASAAAGGVLAVAVVAGAVVELGRGNSGEPFTWLAALGGIAYAAAVIAGRVRG